MPVMRGEQCWQGIIADLALLYIQCRISYMQIEKYLNKKWTLKETTNEE